jgi:hypothetical protein
MNKKVERLEDLPSHLVRPLRGLDPDNCERGARRGQRASVEFGQAGPQSYSRAFPAFKLRTSSGN